MAATRVTGSVITVHRQAGPVFYIKARDSTGRQVKKRLGPAHEGPGRPKPGTWTRKAAEDALREFLVDLGRAPDGPRDTVTVAAASRAFLRYLEHERQRRPSTVADYRNTLNGRVAAHFGAEMPLADVDTAAVDAFRRDLLDEVSRRTAQKTLVIVHGLLGYATRRGWIRLNPADLAEKVTVRRRPEFAVLSPAEVSPSRAPPRTRSCPR